jgi:aspartyl-tRNA(Asn)/glutamyl-tRNA(Gln) amidotransferase subunit A
MSQADQTNPVLRQTMAYLAAIDRANPGLRAFTDVLAAQALAAARVCDANPAGPLHGLNMAIKDNIDTAGAICSAGLPHLQGRRASGDAAVVAALRAAGAVILGVTATDSGAFGVTTPDVTNPALPGRIAGGSSGGSAAAVAAGLCDAALGTDTGGSVRIPAACCGVFGFKPTQGAIAMAGIRPLAHSFDHVGVLARSIPAIRKVVATLAPQLCAAQPAHRPRIAIPWPNLIGTDPAIMACLYSLQSQLGCAGYRIHEITLPDLDDILAVHIGLSLAEAAAFYTDLSAKDRAGLPAAMHTGLALGCALTANRRSDLIARRTAILAKIDRLFDAADYLLLPTLHIQPPLVGAGMVTVEGKTFDVLTALIRFTAPFNQTGHPALAFPWANPENGLSFSLQLVGRRFADLPLLDFAASL